MKSSTRELILAATCAVLAVNSCRLEERIIQIEKRSGAEEAHGCDDEHPSADDGSKGDEDHNQADDNLVDGVIGVVGHDRTIVPAGSVGKRKRTATLKCHLLRLDSATPCWKRH